MKKVFDTTIGEVRLTIYDNDTVELRGQESYEAIYELSKGDCCELAGILGAHFRIWDYQKKDFVLMVCRLIRAIRSGSPDHMNGVADQAYDLVTRKGDLSPLRARKGQFEHDRRTS